jgi:TPR repeat protein
MGLRLIIPWTFGMAKRLLASVLVAHVISGAAIAGPFEDALSAYNNGNYAVALRNFRVLAEQGDARARYNLGLMYWYGDGVDEDDKQARKWFRLAATQGFAPAQNRWGTMLGIWGDPPNYEEAVKWYRLAAEQGNAGAQANLGGVYAAGHGVSYNWVEAIKWYRLAAEQGHTDAQLSLGMVYGAGWQGGDKWKGQHDYVEAAKWYRLAADRDNAEAQRKLGEMYSAGQGVPRDLLKAYMWLTLAASEKPKDIGPSTRALGLYAGGLNERERATVIQERNALSVGMTSEEIAEAQRNAQIWQKQP